MDIVVDTNILFSAVSNSNGKIADVFFSKKNKFVFYSSQHLLLELKKHQNKLIKYTNIENKLFKVIISSFTKRISFVALENVSDISWTKALNLTSDIDIDDVYFVALAIELNAYLWTGDKKLYNGLKEKKFKKVILTQELLKYTYKKK